MARKPQKPYAPNNGARGYDASVLISDGSRPARVALVLRIFLTAAVAIESVAILLTNDEVGARLWLAALITALAGNTLTLCGVLRLRRRLKAHLANGGYIRYEAGEKELTHPPRTLQLRLVCNALVLAAIVIIIATRGLSRLDASPMLPLLVLCIGIAQSSPTYPAIFFDDRFVSELYEIAYNGLTVAPNEHSTHSETRIAVTFTRNGALVGHDTLYREDYEHLRERLAQTEVHDGT
ncbi:MAG: hypothetical protein LBN02_06840 [Oscillospiraceae bacterium]|jgi:hypothetical protein|nr:hypothetical protein [Oscillospiraceae bacterium]